MHKANDILRTIRIKARSDNAAEKHPHFQIDLSNRKRKSGGYNPKYDYD